MTKWWAKLCFDKTWGLPQMAACQELLSAHCFHKKGSPAVCLFWATPVKVPRSPFGVWIYCIKGPCVLCIISASSVSWRKETELEARVYPLYRSQASLCTKCTHFALQSWQLGYSDLSKNCTAGFWRRVLQVFERVYSFRRSIQPLSQCAFEVVYCTSLKERIAGTCKYKRPRVW